MLKLLFKRPTLGLISWLLLISFYLATFLNIAFYKQVLQDLPLDSVRNVLVFLSMPVVAFSVMNIVLTLASFLWLNRLVACIFILVGASAQYFIMTYGIIIDRSMIANMMDTTPAETFALLTPQLLITLGVSGILAALIACWVKIKPITSVMRSILFRGANILISRTGLRLLFGYDGGITITMPCAPGMRLATAIGQTRYERTAVCWSADGSPFWASV